MESIQNFNKGMDLDTNPLNIEKGKYREANNIRIVSDVSSTSFSVNNIKGNLNNITIPDTLDCQKIEIIDYLVTQDLTINGITMSFSTVGMTPQSLYDIIFAACTGAITVDYNVYVGNSYLFVVPTFTTATALVITSTTTALLIDPTFVPAQTGLEVIGSSTLRDDIYLFTTNNTAKNPGGHNPSLTTDASSVGQIWKYVYDKITLAGTLTLVYNNYVDFSTYYAIAPTATTARYENGFTQRIYWTDNFNKLRSLNVADVNSLAFDVTVLDIRPSVDFDIPLLTDIRNSSGAVKAGYYQCAYRLKNTGGAETNYSELSLGVNVVGTDESSNTGGGGPFSDYVGSVSGYVTAKQITWEINNLDRDFDRIEIAIVYRESFGAPASVITISDEPLNADKFIVVYDGTEDEAIVTLDEFLALSGAFTHCKTIGTKDNRLFVGNVRNQLSDIDFDARAYRWTNAPVLDLTENGVSVPYSLATLNTISETSDAINPDNTLYRFQSNGTTLGGEGLNVSYEFMTIASAVDVNTVGDFNVPDAVYAPWRHTNPNYMTDFIDLGVNSIDNTGGVFDQTYTNKFSFGKINAGLKYPSVSTLLKGNQRNEIYRYGLQLFDKSKNPIFVKWIGDIQMPDFWDLNTNSFYEDGTPTGIADFRLSFTGSNNTSYPFSPSEAFVQSLGVKFTINGLEDVSDLISGYSIVRVKREESDKTIVSQGYITLTKEDGGQIYSATLDGNANLNGIGDFTERAFFTTPNICDGGLTAPAAGMTMTINLLLDNVNSKNDQNLAGQPEPYYLWKYYNNLAIAKQTFGIQQCDYVSYSGEGLDSSVSLQVNNYDYFAPTTSESLGNPAWYIRASGYLPWLAAQAISPNGKMLATMSRTLTNQYGGNTYTSRSNNTYISCSQFRPVRTTGVTFTDTFNLFGGDTLVNLYDSCRLAKNYGSTGRGMAAAKRSVTFMYPVESSVNTDLRHGKYTNKNLTSTFIANGEEMQESYEYNTVYSSENDVKSYYPRPDPFLLNEEFDNRFYASEIKINGEFSDSWGIFKVNNYWDTEGTYGPINAMTVLRDKMYFWQNRAFGIIEINPRSVITDVNAATNAQLQIGTGLPLQRHDYLSTEIGLQHQWGVTKSSNKIYWADVANRKMFTYAEGQAISPESDIKGLFAFLTKNLKNNILTIDKPVYDDNACTVDSNAIGVNGVRCVYDFKYNQAIFTFTDGINANEGISCMVNQNNFTIAYDDNINAFTAFYGYTPKVYFSDGYKIFSTDNLSGIGLSDIYMHDVGPYCEFYGVLNESTIRMVVNDNFQYTKAFDNLMYDSQATDVNEVNYHDDTWSTIRVYNDHQNTDFQTLSLGTNLKRKERTYQLAIPRNRVLYSTSNSPDIMTDLSPVDKVMGERMRDKYIVIDLKYNNITNRNLAFNNLRTLFRPSIR